MAHPAGNTWWDARPEYRDEEAFFEDHPDPFKDSPSLARNPMLWIGGPVLTVVVLVLIVMAAMGKFSS